MNGPSRRSLLTGVSALASFAALKGNGRAQDVRNPAGVGLQELATLQSATIQGFGDSITGPANGTYFPSEWDISNIPVWTANTAYPAGYNVQSGGLVFYAHPSGGTSGTTAPTPSTLNDGGITWVYNEAAAYKALTGYLTWAEIFSRGRLSWDMSMGYAGVPFGTLRAEITSGGSGYVNPVAVCTSGCTATVQQTNGVVTGMTILSPGFGGSSCVISDASGPGTGAAAVLLQGGVGTLGFSGDNTAGMIIRLPGAVACPCDIMVVHGGTNDVNGGTPAATTIANLQIIYESLMLSGKRVVAAPITPAFTLVTPEKSSNAARINRWIRAYCRGEVWANPRGFRNIRLADTSGYYTDGTNETAFWPIGGTGGVAGAMTQDGIHPSHRGAAYWGYAVWQACQGWLGQSPDLIGPMYSAVDGYDPLYNPGGNMLEGLPWQASTVYAVGALCCNPTNIYVCTAVTGNATSSASGGPIGTGGGGNIQDGNVTWVYANATRGCSNFSAGTTGSMTAATGIAYSGSLCTGYTLGRASGSATGTVACAIESPWSNGQIGQRQTITFSLGSGTTLDSWYLLMTNNPNLYYGIRPSDLGVTPVYLEADIELSGVAACEGFVLMCQGDRFLQTVGAMATGPGYRMPNSTGEMVTFPNNGKMMLRTQPLIIHRLNTSILPIFRMYFDASGGAGSATVTLKINEIAFRRYAQA